MPRRLYGPILTPLVSSVCPSVCLYCVPEPRLLHRCPLRVVRVVPSPSTEPFRRLDHLQLSRPSPRKQSRMIQAGRFFDWKHTEFFYVGIHERQQRAGRPDHVWDLPEEKLRIDLSLLQVQPQGSLSFSCDFMYATKVRGKKPITFRNKR